MQSALVFCDVNGLAEGVSKVVEGTWHRVKAGACLIAGFSCKDVSRLNSKQSEHRSVIADAVAPTGGTFWGIANHVCWHRPPLLLLENVRGIVGENSRMIKHVFQLMGYPAVVMSLVR